MKKRLIVAGMENYKEFWAYKQCLDYGYEIKVDTKGNITTVQPIEEDGSVYLTFTINHVADEGFLINLDGNDITDELDYSDTLQECICCCLDYFITKC